MSQDVSIWREKVVIRRWEKKLMLTEHASSLQDGGWKAKNALQRCATCLGISHLHWADWTCCRNLPIPPIKCGILKEPPLWHCYLGYWEQTAPSMPDFLCIISLQTPICLEFTLLQNEGCRILCFHSMVWQYWVIMSEPDGTLLSPVARASNNASGAPLEGKMTSNWDFHSMFYSPWEMGWILLKDVKFTGFSHPTYFVRTWPLPLI